MIQVVTTSFERSCLMPDKKLRSFKKFLGEDNVSVLEVADNLRLIEDGTSADDILLVETKRYDILEAICALGRKSTAETVQAVKCDEDKLLLKLVISPYGVKTPMRYDLAQELEDGKKYFVKPFILEDSIGIDGKSLCSSAPEVLERVRLIKKKYGQSSIVEEFIEGYDCTVGILADKETNERLVMPLRIYPNNKVGYLTYEAKTSDTETYVRVPEEHKEAINIAAIKTFLAIGARKYARIDMRVTQGGVPYVLEVNLYPGLGETGYMYRCFQIANGFLPEEVSQNSDLHRTLYTRMLCYVLGLPFDKIDGLKNEEEQDKC